ncbi:hypothetical protein Tco_0749972 [Tanacetum coccineum]|uniref:Uncharacterized protein n=1 Tax=Tanacetum coccineum TaxID=301880 RepID=A0ABQ4Z2L2_9ASTR
MASVQGQNVEQSTTTTTPAIQNATTEVPLFSSSHSVSSNCTIAFLNFENIHSTKPEVVSILDINVQHEVPHTSPLLTIPVSVIHEHTIFNPSEIVATASATTISSQLSSLFPFLQQSTLIPTPTTTEATTSTTVLKDVDNSSKVISTIKYEVPNVVKEYIGSNLDDALHKVIQRNFADIIKKHSVPAETVERLRQQYAPQKSIKDIREIKMEHARKHPKHIALYHALMESILEDEKAMDKGVVDELKKRKQDDTDKDEGPSAGSDQGLLNLEREDLGNTDEQPNDKAVLKNDCYKKSRSDTSPDPEWNEGKSVDDGPEQSWLNDMAKAIKPPLTFDKVMHTPIDFSAFVMNHLKIDNLTKEILVGPTYNLLKGTCKSYVELDYTIEECYRALSEKLDWNNPEGHRCLYDLTKPLPVQMSSQGRQIILVNFFVNNALEYLRGGSNDKKYTASTTKSKAVRYAILGISHWQTKRQNFYGYTTKMGSKHDVYMTKRIIRIISVKVNEWYGYDHLEEIVVKRADQQLYTFKEGDFKRLHLSNIKDMLLLVVQNKLHNLDTNVVVHMAVNLRIFARRTVIQARVEDLQLGVESYQRKLNLTKPRTRDVDMSRRPSYTTLLDPRGVIYEDKLKRKRFMRTDELHKFSDGTLISVHDTLN